MAILSPVTGFLKQAGFTHSLTPARNCTFGCTYCYVPTMRIQGGLKPDDWRHWGQFTTFKTQIAERLAKALRPDQVIYCSPLTDPYQPAEAEATMMPGILQAVASHPPRSFVIQTRGPLILRDLSLVKAAAATVSFSVTTSDDRVRRIFEPHCAPIAQRWETISALRSADIPVCATLAPLLPGDPDALIDRALEFTDGPVVADPLHVRALKPTGATTRESAIGICHHHGCELWLDPAFQTDLLTRMAARARAAGRQFGHGPAGFGLLTGTIPQVLVSDTVKA